MKRALFAFIFVCAITSSAIASDASDARSIALGNASVVLSDGWSCFQNQAGLALIKTPVAGISYQNQFLISALSTKNIFVALPTKAGTFAVSSSMYGYSKYNEKQACVAYAKKLGQKVSAGIQLNYLNTFIADEYYGSKSSFVAEGGIIAEPLKNFKVGLHLYNPNRAKLAAYADEHIPTILRLGASYQFSEKTLWTVEEEKDIDQQASFKSGIEYHFADALYLRAGIGTNSTLFAFGFGFKYEKIVFDAASTYDQILGYSPSASFSFEF